MSSATACRRSSGRGSSAWCACDERGCGLSAADRTALGLDASVKELQVVVDAVAARAGRLAIMRLSV